VLNQHEPEAFLRHMLTLILAPKEPREKIPHARPSSGCPSPSGAAHLLTAKPDKVAQAVYPAVILELQEGHLFALDAAYDVAVSLGRLGVAAKHHGLAAVGGHDDGLVIGDDPE